MTININIDEQAAREQAAQLREAGRPRHALTSSTSEHHTVTATLQRAGATVEPRPFWPHLLLVLGLALVAGAALVAAIISIMKAVS